MTFNQLTLKEALDALANSSLTIEELYRDLNLAIKEKNQFYNIYLNLNDQAEPVSYTHLTLPTIYSV